MSSSIAIIGMACVYPDARTPGELWENALAQRRAFRRLPGERLRGDDYWSADASQPDTTYTIQAAVIEGYEFDRISFRVAGGTYRAADPAHWLALEVASRALADAGFADGEGLPREATGVLLGNTLTGEFSRANALRLRWPYVRRVLEPALARQGWEVQERSVFLAAIEAQFKAPFPPVDEETLAGGLSNTIAGRICNQFDLKGGGYTVDGACASSLLAVANACAALEVGDLDVALAGGVDLSLDPFELVGFAKTGALAPDEMRVYDRRSAGFWPGEGCGFVTLMRHDEAIAQGRRVYAIIRGWGISSDGKGGITRPEISGQLEALRRAYRRAGFDAGTVGYCEGHGTGTAVGDATELEALSRARSGTNTGAAIGSIKANIGHTKAAAGLAGLIKATMAVHTQLLPPTTGCQLPHARLKEPSAALRILREPEFWPGDRPLRASVSAMGFGGINAHVVLEGTSNARRAALTARERALSRSSQDAELFLFAAESVQHLTDRVETLLGLAAGLSRAELTDLAAHLQKTLLPGSIRAAVVAARPDELELRLQKLLATLRSGTVSQLDFANGVLLSANTTTPRLGFLFPGQGSPAYLDGGAWSRRFDSVRALYARAELPVRGDPISTSIMQPAVVTASLAGLAVLREFGLDAVAGLGHSLGEFSALHWGGAFDEAALRRIVRVRASSMAELGSPTGAMLAISAPAPEVLALLNGDPLTVVGFNSPRQTVVSGDAAAIDHLAQTVGARGLTCTKLPVSHAFHTPLVAAAVPLLADQLRREAFSRLQRPVISTVTGAPLANEDMRELLCRQVTSPVRFQIALDCLLGRADGASADQPAVDLLVEVGPGAVLTSLVRDITNTAIVALDAGSESLVGLLQTVGAAFVLGAPVRHAGLFEDRFARPFSPERKPKFFQNPCESAPPPMRDGAASPTFSTAQREQPRAHEKTQRLADELDPPGLIRAMVAERAELPLTAIQDSSRMLSDLHLNSIIVGQLVSEAAQRLGLPRIVGTTDFANASVEEMAQALVELKRTGAADRSKEGLAAPPGVDTWVRSFAVELIETPRARRIVPAGPAASPVWQVFAPPNHDLADTLKESLYRTGRGGVLVCLPANPTTEHLHLLLAGGQAAIARKDSPCFVVVQHGWGGGGFARSLHREQLGLNTCVINIPAGGPGLPERVAAEVSAANGFVEVHFDSEGRRFEPRLKLALPASSTGPRKFPVGPADVIVVTGGGKGIAAECALALGRESGASLALLGRSSPQQDSELARNLERFAAAGVRVRYVRADVTDAAAVRAAIAEVESQLGPVTGFVHGAGLNTPRLISGLDEAAFRRTMVPKIGGMQNVVAALEPGRLRLLVVFGSIIARTGLAGEADYATANEWLRVMTEEFQAAHPRCRCLAIEWSVWSGAGMGERLGRIESLLQHGITPITVDAGVRVFCDLIARPGPATALVVTGRFGDPPTLKLVRNELPLQRFLARCVVNYPGIELIVDASLSADTDPYLDDHVMQRQRLLPAVLGLEAMAQTAMALAGVNTMPDFESVEFTRPVAIPATGSVAIRLAALQREAGVIEVCLRTEATDFQVDHFRAVCRFQPAAGGGQRQLAAAKPASGAAAMSLDPRRDLYGRLLFHRGRFCRVLAYRFLQARECVAEIAADDGAVWFGPYLPSGFVLGNPAARDAALHAIQACIPHWRILPTGMERLTILRPETGARLVRARERSHQGQNFIYDVEITNLAGELVERWDGLMLRGVEALVPPDAWPEALLAPYWERRLGELLPGTPVRLELQRDGRADGSTRTEAAIHQALGRAERVWRRPDGKPSLLAGECVSAAHCAGLTLALATNEAAGCDLETVTARSEEAWQDLLGWEDLTLARRIAREANEELDISATRLWSARECLKKAGSPPNAPLTLASSGGDDWVLFRSGGSDVATSALAVRDRSEPLVMAVVLQAANATASVLAPAGG